jgi:predicted ATPase
MVFLRSVELVAERVRDREEYPFSIAAVRDIEKLVFHPKVTFLAGENGTGKSTLLEAAAVAAGFNAEGGSRNFTFQTTHEPSTSKLHAAIRLIREPRRPRTGYFFRAESFFNVATEIDRLDSEPTLGPSVRGSYGGRSLHAVSHGESFLAFFMNRMGPDGLYILDEPDAALSITRQFAFLRRLHELTQAHNGQFIIGTHSPVILSYPDARIFELTEAGIEQVAYLQSRIYMAAREFFRDPNRFLERLLHDDADRDADTMS